MKTWELETAVRGADGFVSIKRAEFTHRQSALKLARYLEETYPGTEYRLWHWQKQRGSRYQMVWHLCESTEQSLFPVKCFRTY